MWLIYCFISLITVKILMKSLPLVCSSIKDTNSLQHGHSKLLQVGYCISIWLNVCLAMLFLPWMKVHAVVVLGSWCKQQVDTSSLPQAKRIGKSKGEEVVIVPSHPSPPLITSLRLNYACGRKYHHLVHLICSMVTERLAWCAVCDLSYILSSG